MVREVLPKLSDHPSTSQPAEEPTPRMFQRISDVPEPLPPVRQSDQVDTLHREWARGASAAEGGATSFRKRLALVRRRITGRAPTGFDRAMIADLIRAVDAVAARCDVLSERLAHRDVVVDDVATIYGEELTRLRVEVALLASRTLGASSPPIHHE